MMQQQQSSELYKRYGQSQFFYCDKDPKWVDIIDEEQFQYIAVQLVRMVKREYNTTITPIIRGLVINMTPDPYGNTILAEVQYHATYIAVYGGSLDLETKKVTWQCYAD